MILILYILTPFTMSSTISLFQGFRIIQTRMMILSVIHGLKTNPKLKAILEGCANLQHLWGSTLASHKIIFLHGTFFALSVCTFVLHTFQICNPHFTLGLPCITPWIESTADPGNFSN